MIVVVGRVESDAERRDALIAAGQKVAGSSRQEPGCISYRLYEDTEQPNAFVFIEEWADDEALQDHFRTPHIAEFMSAMPATLTAPPDVRFHTIERTRDLSNVTSAS
jgi:quinol monooxygenase YgiN